MMMKKRSGSSFSATRVECISEIDPLRGIVLNRLTKCAIYPASHYVATKETLERAIEEIRNDLRERLQWFRAKTCWWRRSGWSSGSCSIWR